MGIAEQLTWFDRCDDTHGNITFLEQASGGSMNIVGMFSAGSVDDAAAFVKQYVEANLPDSGRLFLKTSLFNREAIDARRTGNLPIAGNQKEVQTVTGFALDVDAGKLAKDGKPGSYAGQEDVWQALQQMPVPPSMLILSGEQNHGFHAWFKLDTPIVIESPADCQSINHIIRAWKNLLIEKIVAVIEADGRSVPDDKRDTLVDNAFTVDRVLRVVGTVRATRNNARVQFAAPMGGAYSLDQLTAPGYQPLPERIVSNDPFVHNEDSPIGKYFKKMEDAETPITVHRLLTAEGYTSCQDSTRWSRPGATSMTLDEGTSLNGISGVNVFSGNCPPLKCSDDRTGVGRWYSLISLWVAFTFGDVDDPGNWAAAAAFCHLACPVLPGDVFEDTDDADDTDAIETTDRNWMGVESNRNENYLTARFVDLYGKDLRYVAAWKAWIVWDGRRFALDPSGQMAVRVAMKFARRLWRDQANLGQSKTANAYDLKKALAFCDNSNKAKAINAIVSLARANERILIEHTELNTDPYLLNVTNGTIDLRTGEIRKHDRSDLITLLAPVRFEPGACCPKWDGTLDRVFGGDAELIRYVQKIFGYSTSGDAGEAILPIAYGDGNNGKSTIWNCILELIGDYGTLASESLLLGEKNAHPTEKAALYQKRIVAVSEPEAGAQLKEARAKELTGDSMITARRMHEDFWTFKRTHTFWLSSNHLPRIKGTDEGIWRRIKLIPFKVNLGEQPGFRVIKNFHAVMAKEEGPGILNWLLAGFSAYVAEGLDAPKAVNDAVEVYRGDEDVLGLFINERLETGDRFKMGAAEAYSAYLSWGGKWSQVQLKKALSVHFGAPKRTKKGIFYSGVRIDPTRQNTEFFEIL